ncbi:DUF2147 domain-containing protein [Sphingomonas sp. CJ20]
MLSTPLPGALRGPMIAAAALLVALPISTAAQSGADSALLGKWRTERKDGMVEIHRCGAALCGRVLDGAPLRANPDQRDVHNPDPALRTRKVKGLRVLDGFSGGPKRWKGGPLYDPETGNLAGSGTLTLTDADTLAVKGCIAMFLCRTQTWRRAR